VKKGKKIVAETTKEVRRETEELITRASGAGSNGHPQAPLAPLNVDLFRRQCGLNDLPCIVLAGDVPLRTQTDKALDILRARNRLEPFIFQRSGKLVTIRTIKRERAKDGKIIREKIIVDIDQDILRGMLTRSMNFVRVNTQGITVQVDPPQAVIHDLLSVGNWPLPILAGITEVPTLRPDGSILDTPGYDKTTQLVYVPDEKLKMDPIPAVPTREDIEAAKEVILEVLGDFPYEDEADYANAVGALLTAVIRPAIDGHVPFLLIDATRAGTGKSRLADIMAYAATGQMGAFKGAPDNNAEWGKVITTTLMEGGQINIFDNLRARLDSSALDRLITSTLWSDRVLGTNENVKLPNRGVWLATGNDIIIGGDLPRRVYRIRLDAGTATPWTRTGPVSIEYDEEEDEGPREVVDHEFINLDEWLPENRGRLVGAVLTIARAWFVAGKPLDKKLPMFGSFEQWAPMIGGMLKNAGVKGFLANLTKDQMESDYENRRWAHFVQVLHDTYGDSTFSTWQIAMLVLSHDRDVNHDGIFTNQCELCDALPEAISFRGKTEQDFKAKLGLALARKKGRVFDDSTGYNIEVVIDTHAKTNTYQIATKRRKKVNLRGV